MSIGAHFWFMIREAVADGTPVPQEFLDLIQPIGEYDEEGNFTATEGLDIKTLLGTKVPQIVQVIHVPEGATNGYTLDGEGPNPSAYNLVSVALDRLLFDDKGVRAQTTALRTLKGIIAAIAEAEGSDYFARQLEWQELFALMPVGDES